VAANVIALLIELGVLLVILLFAGNMVLPWIPAMLGLAGLLAMIVIGIGLTLSVLNVYFRDMQHFIPIVLQALFYATPIVYPISLVPDEGTLFGIEIPVGFLYRLNPLVHVVQAFRSVLYDLRFPPLNSTLYIVGWAIGSVIFGLWVFSRLDRRLAEEV
jgi:lipopolysaccharide transport system permease protein